MRIGEIRIRLLRVAQYASIVTMIAAVATAVKVEAFPLWSILIVLPFVVVAFLVDSKLVQGENAYFNRNNAELQQIISDIQEVKRELKR